MRSFPDWDIYYLFEYADSFRIHGDGIPLLIDYRDESCRLCYVVMLSDLADCPKFSGTLEHGRFFDMETPYGYGGPLCDGLIPPDSQKRFSAELTDFCRAHGIVSQFVRFHPLLANYGAVESVIETLYLRDTIYIDTSSPERIMTNMDSKNRNMVRKALKNGVSIERCPIEDYGDFLSMYEETMRKDKAEEYYTFHDDYFRSQSALRDNACLFYANKDGRPIAGAIMYYNERYLHYHLAGTHTEYRQFSPSNLLLYEAACWASERGIRKFHLGGGMAPDDGLFGFKKQFNKNGRLPFHIGRTVFAPERYDELLRLRKKLDPLFDTDNGRLIQYRR